MTTNTPIITLGGRAFELPKLAPRQNRIVVPMLLELVPRILRAREEAKAAGGQNSFATLARYLDTQSYDTLVTLVFAALTRATPSLTKESFDDMAIDTFELIAAVMPIARAAGLLAPSTASAFAKAPADHVHYVNPPKLSVGGSRFPSPTLRAGEES
jgi:hypothetical protein